MDIFRILNSEFRGKSQKKLLFLSEVQLLSWKLKKTFKMKVRNLRKGLNFVYQKK